MPYIKVTLSRAKSNRYKVPKRQWKRWSEAGRMVFNATYSAMTRNQLLFSHPEAERIPTNRWRTICWNAAWIAAGEASVA